MMPVEVKNMEKLIKDLYQKFRKENVEMIDRWLYFAYEEIPSKVELSLKDRCLSILAVLLGSQGQEEFGRIVIYALDQGVEAEAIQEVVYQATAYLGMGRVAPFYSIVDRVFLDRNVQVRQDRQTTNLQDRLEKGNALQVRYFGEGLKETWKNGGERENVNYWLAANCFGDYYTRKGLNDQEREMVTFCYVYAQGGCENQLRGHTRGNLNVGNSKEKLLAILSTCIPWIGYPRTLNAWAIVDEVTKE